MKPAKFSADATAQEFDHSEVLGEDGSITIAFLKMFRNDEGVRIGLLWSPIFFNNAAVPLPDELRKILVETLRFHADKLESREMDERIKKLTGKMMGDA